MTDQRPQPPQRLILADQRNPTSDVWDGGAGTERQGAVSLLCLGQVSASPPRVSHERYSISFDRTFSLGSL